MVRWCSNMLEYVYEYKVSYIPLISDWDRSTRIIPTFPVCSKGWEAYDGSCYKFAADDKQQYSGSRDACASLGAQLVKITNSRFLKRVLQERHADLPTWRTAGRKIGDHFKWQDPSGKKRHRKMKYKVWFPRHPAKYTTLVLDVATSKNDTRVWKGTWAGTPRKPDQFSYPYICEKKDYSELCSLCIIT